MAQVDKHSAGDFCWIELMTSDQNAAKAFYGTLFGWTANDMPMGPGQFYTIFRKDARDVGAAFGTRAEERGRGIPTHWHLYVAVEAADQAAAKAANLGGKVLEGPFDVLEAGRMAVIQDPTGAVLSVFQPKQHTGIGVQNEPGTFCWADLITPGPKRAGEFYSGLFGWEVFAAPKDRSGYLHIKNKEQFIGGIPPVRHQGPNAVPHWVIYFAVADVDQSAKRAQELGGRLYSGPMDIEGAGRMAILADPQAAAFAIFKPARRE